MVAPVDVSDAFGYAHSVAVSENGWTNNNLCEQWFRKVFIPEAKEANTTDATKATRFCQICSGKGKKGAAKTHNTNDCYDKPGNESKRPQPKASSSGTS